MNDGGQSRNASGSVRMKKIILIATLAVLVLAVAVFASLKLGLPGFIGEKLSFLKNNVQAERDDGYLIPDFSPDNSVSLVVPNEPGAEELFALAEERDSYVRELRVIYVVNDENRSKKYTVSKFGERYKLDGEAYSVLSDGDTVRVRNAVSEYTADSRDYDMYSEIGITSLDKLKRIVAENSGRCTLGMSESRRYIRVSVSDDDGSITAEYNISVEFGAVTAEYHYYDGKIYLAVVTDSISVPDIGDEEYFGKNA